MDSGRAAEKRMAQATKHSALFLGGGIQRFELFLCEESLATTDERLRDNFKQGTGCDFDEAGKIRSRRAGTSFRKVGGDGHCRSPHLISKAKPFVWRKPASQIVDQVRELYRLLPRLKFFEVEHKLSPLSLPSTINSPPSAPTGHAPTAPLLGAFAIGSFVGSLSARGT